MLQALFVSSLAISPHLVVGLSLCKLPLFLCLSEEEVRREVLSLLLAWEGLFSKGKCRIGVSKLKH